MKKIVSPLYVVDVVALLLTTVGYYFIPEIKFQEKVPASRNESQGSLHDLYKLEFPKFHHMLSLDKLYLKIKVDLNARMEKCNVNCTVYFNNQ